MTNRERLLTGKCARGKVRRLTLKGWGDTKYPSFLFNLKSIVTTLLSKSSSLCISVSVSYCLFAVLLTPSTLCAQSKEGAVAPLETPRTKPPNLSEEFILNGHVFDEKGRPLEFATIEIPLLNIGTHSDSKGSFSLPIATRDSNIVVQFRYVNKVTQVRKIARANWHQPLQIFLEELSLTLKDVQVQGVRERLHSNSSIVIDREAIEQMQAFSLADVLQALPGKKTVAPDLQHPQTLTLRTDATGQNAFNNSFGIAIFVDGIRISNDANMQARNLSIRGIGENSFISSKSDGSFDVAYNGFDLRDIPVENIERIEIIQGIADARYGELTNGAILITTRAGASPVTVSIKTNGGSAQASLSKGIALGGKAGALNISGGYTYSNADPTDKIKSYERINTSLKWSVDIARHLSNSFTFGYDKRLDDVKSDPDDGDRRTFASGHNLKLSNSLSWQPASGLIQRLTLNAAYSRGRQETYSEFILNNAVRPVADKDTTGIYEGYYVPGAYMAVEHIIGIPVSINGSLDLNSRSLATGQMRHQLQAGATVASSGNHGPGIIIDPNKPRWNIFHNQSERPVDYSKLVPFLTNIGFYLQDNISGKLWDKRYGIHLGLRSDFQNGFMSYQPRISGQYQFLPHWGISLAYGVSTKAPSLAHRYPAPTWLDIPLLNLYTGNPDESLYLVYTRQVPTDNTDLKPAMSKSLELGFNYKGEAGNGSLTLYAKKNTDGFSTAMEYIPIVLPDFGYTITADKTIDYYPTGGSTLYGGVSRSVVSNGGYSADYGIELMYSTREIKPLATRLSVSSGFVYSEFDQRFQRTVQSLSEAVIHSGSPAIYGVYNGTTYTNKTWNSTLSSITHIPKLGFTVNLSMDLSLMQTRISPQRDNLAIGYLDRNLHYVEIPQSQRGDEQFEYLKRDLDVFSKQELPFAYANINMTIAKEIKKKIRLTLRGYNLFNILPRDRKPGTNTWTVYNSPASITAGITLTL